MSWEGEIYALLMSDVSSAGVEVLTSKLGLWARNSLIHFSLPFVTTIAYFHAPSLRAWIKVSAALYIALQVAQLWSPGTLSALVLDGIWDVLCAAFGACLAWWLAMRSIPVERGDSDA